MGLITVVVVDTVVLAVYMWLRSVVTIVVEVALLARDPSEFSSAINLF
jgi:hypothetical protein